MRPDMPWLKTLRRVGGHTLHRVRVGGVPEHFNSPWHTAAVKGLFDANGLQVEWTDFPGGTGAMTKALRAGEIDIALALTEGLVADMHRRNPQYKLLGTYVASPLTWGVHAAAKNSKLQCMADLGQSVRYAVSRMGSGSHLMACVDAHARGLDPSGLTLEIVGGLDGARDALLAGRADVFMWETFTAKFLVDAGDWKRIGEVPTPWPCFSIAATDEALESGGAQLLRLLEVVRQESADLLASPNCAKTIGLMYGQHEKDVVEWLKGVRWCCRPTVSHAIIKDVMRSLVDAAVLKPSELLPPSALLSSLTRDEVP